jgi:hypothetical protein
MHKRIKQFLIVFGLIMAFSTAVNAFAEPLQLVIYTVEGPKTSNILNCSNYIDFDGVNSIYSTNDLYVELLENGTLFDTTIVSLRLVPGTGWMGEEWYHILANYNLARSNVPLKIHLDPAGAIAGCFGAGKLTDLP